MESWPDWTGRVNSFKVFVGIKTYELQLKVCIVFTMFKQDFYGTIRPVLVIGWILGVLPISNVSKTEIQLLSCKNLSRSLLYSTVINIILIIPSGHCILISLLGVLSSSKNTSATDTLSLSAFVGLGVLVKFIIVILCVLRRGKILKFIQVN